MEFSHNALILLFLANQVHFPILWVFTSVRFVVAGQISIFPTAFVIFPSMWSRMIMDFVVVSGGGVFFYIFFVLHKNYV